MAKFHIELNGGAFGEGKKLAYYDTWGKDTITFTLGLKNRLKHEKIKMKDIESIQIASEEAIKKMGATFGWGLAGLALLGPLGMAAGLLGGGRSKVVTFIGILKDDRKFLASMNNKGFVKLQGAHMTNSI